MAPRATLAAALMPAKWLFHGPSPPLLPPPSPSPPLLMLMRSKSSVVNYVRLHVSQSDFTVEILKCPLALVMTQLPRL